MKRKVWSWCLAGGLFVCWAGDSEACGRRHVVRYVCVCTTAVSVVPECPPCAIIQSSGSAGTTGVVSEELPEPKKPELKKIPEPLPKLKAPPGE